MIAGRVRTHSGSFPKIRAPGHLTRRGLVEPRRICIASPVRGNFRQVDISVSDEDDGNKDGQADGKKSQRESGRPNAAHDRII